MKIGIFTILFIILYIQPLVCKDKDSLDITELQTLYDIYIVEFQYVYMNASIISTKIINQVNSDIESDTIKTIVEKINQLKDILNRAKCNHSDSLYGLKEIKEKIKIELEIIDNQTSNRLYSNTSIQPNARRIKYLLEKYKYIEQEIQSDIITKKIERMVRETSKSLSKSITETKNLLRATKKALDSTKKDIIFSDSIFTVYSIRTDSIYNNKTEIKIKEAIYNESCLSFGAGLHSYNAMSFEGMYDIKFRDTCQITLPFSTSFIWTNKNDVSGFGISPFLGVKWKNIGIQVGGIYHTKEKWSFMPRIFMVNHGWTIAMQYNVITGCGFSFLTSFQIDKGGSQ